VTVDRRVINRWATRFRIKIDPAQQPSFRNKVKIKKALVTDASQGADSDCFWLLFFGPDGFR
jgi:hypothetical protein